jgi:crossover junction endodeoxyribonuclease RuvC
VRILGVDPGLDTTGYGIIDDAAGKISLLEAGVINTSHKESIEVRLKKIYRGIAGLIDKFKPNILVLEKLYSHYRHPVTAILMGHGRGVICLAAGEQEIQLISYPAKKIKKALTGNGNASKQQVQRMVGNVLSIQNAASIPVDVTDALAAALAHSYERKAAINDIAHLRKGR